jgi:hypothetical protein
MPGNAHLLPHLRPIRPHELEPLRAAAAADAHEVIDPTHVLVREGKIIGYASLAHHVSLVNCWISSAEAGPLDSLCALSAVESLVAEHGSRGIVLPCDTKSPFYSKLARLGYRTLGESTISTKGV